MSIEFGLDPFEPSNMMYVGMQEELMEQVVNDAIDYLRKKYGVAGSLTKDEMEEVFEKFDIEYPLLPHWLAVKFDEFDIILQEVLYV